MKSLKTTERVYYLLVSLFWFATSLPLALSILLMQSRGINLFEIGITMGTYSLIIVLLEIPTGGLADAIGRKKVAIIAYTFSILASIALLFAFTFPMLMLGFVIYGIARALSTGTLDAWVVDTLQEIDPEVDLQPFFSKAGTFTLLSLGAGTLIGSLIPDLFNFLPADSTTVLTPLSMPIFFASIFQLVLIIFTSKLVVEVRPEDRAGQWKEGFRMVPGIIKIGFGLSRKNPVIMLLLGAGLAAGFAMSAGESFWQPHFAEIFGTVEGNSIYFGIIMGGNFLVGMLGNMFATWLSKLLNKRYAIVAAIFQGFWGLSLLLLTLQILPIPSVLFFWSAYFSIGVVNSPHQTLLNEEIPSEHRSSMLSIASFFSYIGGMLSGGILGYISENVSIRSSWQIAGIVLVVSLILYWRIDILKNRHTLPVQETAQ
jgi:MFS family permease